MKDEERSSINFHPGFVILSLLVLLLLAHLSPSPATFENTNAQRVADAQRGLREVSRAQSATRQARDKAALTADRDSKAKKKEERKKHAQKQERRS